MSKTKRNILILNGGSSSLKFALYNENLDLLFRGIIEQIAGKSFIQYENFLTAFKSKEIYININTHFQGLEELNKIFAQEGFVLENIKNIGHRVVHGGQKYSSIQKINKKVEEDIEDLASLAPIHNPVNLVVIRAAKKAYPKSNNWAIFDTGFYQDLPEEARIYALPYAFYQKHNIQRYGFHGTSHAYILEETATFLKKKKNQINIISCHLGSGASVTAIKKGKAIETSMGFTPLEGLVMATRSGDIDPSIIFYLEEKLKLQPETINYILNRESGWMGISGFKDMRELLSVAGYKVEGYKHEGKRSKKDKERCQLAINIFIHRLVKYIGAYSLLLGKVDAIVLTAGVGERSNVIYKLLEKEIQPLLAQKVKLLQIPTDEELMMARYIKKESK